MSYFDYDPELPAGFQDADLEMAELIDAGNRSARTTIIPQKACADCEAYTFVNTMVEKADGRAICRRCDAEVLEKQRQSAQSNLFVQQPNLF